MKWYLISKDDSNEIVLKKSKTQINSKEECLKFIHKKNKNKGKLQSISLLGPYKVDNINKWVVIYKEPLNKNHKDSEWIINTPEGKINVFNGAILIHTKSSTSEETDFPLFYENCVNVESTEIKEWKQDINEFDEKQEELNDEEKEEDNDEENEEIEETVIDDEEDDDDEEDTLAVITEVNEDEDEEEEDEENIVLLSKKNKKTKFKGDLVDDVFEQPKLENSTEIAIELENDLTKAGALEYEKYDYECEIIPNNYKL
jgi:hypothetical protein